MVNNVTCEEDVEDDDPFPTASVKLGQMEVADHTGEIDKTDQTITVEQAQPASATTLAKQRARRVCSTDSESVKHQVRPCDTRDPNISTIGPFLRRQEEAKSQGE